MYKLIFIFFLFYGKNSLAQGDLIYCLKDTLGIYKNVEIEAIPPDGIYGLSEFLRKNWKVYEDEYGQPVSLYEIVLVIKEDGKVNVKCINGKESKDWNKINEQNSEMINSMPKWTAAICNNKKVVSYYYVKFYVDYY